MAHYHKDDRRCRPVTSVPAERVPASPRQRAAPGTGPAHEPEREACGHGHRPHAGPRPRPVPVRRLRLPGSFGGLARAGKPRMQTVGACLRKLVMLCYGVLKNRAPFDPDWASKKAA